MVLGSVALLCLALGVLATLNLGQAVHERIKLQNNADSAAYSLATLEARTFNFIAFTNRLQITHYHTAMVVQSYLSYAGFAVAMLGTAADVTRSLLFGNQTGCKVLPPPANKPFCIAAMILLPISLGQDAMVRGVQGILDGAHEAAKIFIEAMSLYNRDAVYRRIQLARAVQLNAHILTGMEDFVKRNDKSLTYSMTESPGPFFFNAALNSYEYWKTFDKGSGVNPSALGLLTGAIQGDLLRYTIDAGPPDVKEAQSIMAEIANATRSHPDVYNRSREMVGAALPPGFVGGPKLGQTRMIGGAGDIRPRPPINAIGTQGHYAAGGCTGDRLASDDFLTSRLAMAVGQAGPETSVTLQSVSGALGDGILTAGVGSMHFRYRWGGGFQEPVPPLVFPIPPDKPWGNSHRMEPGGHPWTGAPLAPYVKFMPGPKTREYNQPSTWMYLNKKPKDFQTDANKKPWHMGDLSVNGVPRGNYVRNDTGNNADVSFKATGGSSTTLDTTVGGERQAILPIFQGLNVIARGQVYYHRPDDWQEQPNFFNPFWRARLAPVAAVLTNLWEEVVHRNLAPSIGAPQLQQWIQNFANNALTDLFFTVVTQLITH
jgi:hypothetical protein